MFSFSLSSVFPREKKSGKEASHVWLCWKLWIYRLMPLKAPIEFGEPNWMQISGTAAQFVNVKGRCCSRALLNPPNVIFTSSHLGEPSNEICRKIWSFVPTEGGGGLPIPNFDSIFPRGFLLQYGKGSPVPTQKFPKHGTFSWKNNMLTKA